MQTRQLFVGIVLALAVFFAYQWLINLVYPPRKPVPPASQPAATQMAEPETAPTIGAATSGPTASAPTTTPHHPTEYAFVAAPDQEPIMLGGRPDDALSMLVTPRGGAVEAIHLTQRKDGKVVYTETAGDEAPYEILHARQGDGEMHTSFATARIEIEELGSNRSWRLDQLIWKVEEASRDKIVFSAALHGVGDEQGLLRIIKTYTLVPQAPLVRLTLSVENTGSTPLTILLHQQAAATIERESPMYEMRRLLVAQREGNTISLSGKPTRGELKKSAEGENLFIRTEEKQFAWTALANRFFAIFVRPLPQDGVPAEQTPQVVAAWGELVMPGLDEHLGDMRARLVSKLPKLAPGQSCTQTFEVYVGPKDPDILKTVEAEFVDTTMLNYGLAHAADQRCCTFEPLPQIMVGLLHWIQKVVRNYGIAIIILVIIVRALLHPLAVYQQKQMYRMQDSMARLQPRLNELKERYANDKVKQNQETMKVYAEEGVNPMGSIVSMLPMFLQMPILIALWQGLNTDIALRHAALDGWWIKDLAAPDALLVFDPPITIPILGHLPLLSKLFSGIPSFNLLPILMGVSMWLQQRYMPKPGMQAKLDAAKKEPEKPRKPGQLSAEDQIRQQRMMGYMMTFMFPLMFYYMPSGLNLYWMATNVFGIGESLIVRKQIREEHEKRQKLGPQPPKKRKPGLMSKMLHAIAEQANEMQRRADEVSEHGKQPPRRDKNDGKGRKQR